MPAFARLRSLHLGSMAAPVSAIIAYCSAMPNLSSHSSRCMAEEWPDLEELYFATKSYSRCANLDACTLAALAPFGSHCPRLKALGFPFDAMKCGAREDLLDDVPWCPDVPGYRSQADQCTTLLVTRSPVSEQASNLVNAASFLSHVFPRLEDIIQGPFDDTEEGKAHARSWGEVESYVMVLNNNRQNERQRLGLEDDLPGSPDQQPPTTPSEQSPDDTAGAWMWSSGNDE
ncbi:hypothetical protein NUW54_g11295 [Trametes sanguinea]|uniref:Uncharacterized protein n=1 Tax=Trametes sanguinea TaxID=158606 RepID=A0ACC1NGB3_9APHY|nr:hypothetical protein NUW54_g11295 [Trametes sanguinea]